MKPTELKPEISIVFEKPGILPRPFNEYFNQAVLSKMKVKEVPSIDLTVEDEFDGIESLITYHLSKDEENDHVMLGVEMRRFTPIALDRFSYIGVEKMNRLLESLGMKD